MPTNAIATRYYQGYLETFNMTRGFTRDEYCFVEIAEKCIVVRMVGGWQWDILHGDEVGQGHFVMRSLVSHLSATGTLHRAPGYGEIEGYIEFDDIPCLIKIELIKSIKKFWD
ncbi:hypothetical protein [Pusillimonas minor]|uniref:Uncharacterized protein n=1 Tax=Pusillimonas minor TaxID=2697024 RepID=A0A842HTD0_9BURK|nr:hypothetical protein [Pusillimonas minor]MBC2770898.1 hypothetical protein [Pusillimonas minor]